MKNVEVTTGGDLLLENRPELVGGISGYGTHKGRQRIVYMPVPLRNALLMLSVSVSAQ